MKVLLVRHGETVISALGNEGRANPPEDIPLSTPGGRQAEIAGMLCVEEAVEMVFSSPIYRAWQTAGAISYHCDALRIPVEGLRERDWGEWGSLTWGEVEKRLEGMDLEQRYSFVPPGGESWQAMEQRGLAAMEEIAASGHKSVAIVSHKGLLRAVLSPLLGEPRAQAVKRELQTGAVTALERQNNKWSLLYLNRTMDKL